jgi:hypothetical protein
MLSLQITDIKQATSHLFTQNSFDYFLVLEADITTFSTFQLDGHLCKDYFSQEELENLRDTTYCSWQMIRPICYSLIKGKHLPHSFHIVLSLSQNNIDNFLKQYHLEEMANDLKGLYLNFKYENQVLQVVSGISLNIFTMDKTIEHAWDDMTKKLLKHHGIGFE